MEKYLGNFKRKLFPTEAFIPSQAINQMSKSNKDIFRHVENLVLPSVHHKTPSEKKKMSFSKIRE